MSAMVLARLLTPAEVGVFSITMVLVSFATTFRDLGAGQYLVQEKELTPDRVRAVWAVQLGAGGMLALVAALAAHPVSTFYDEPRMGPILWVLAAGFMLNPLGSITYAWLMRNMRYDALAVMRFSGALVGAGVAVTLAWLGHGPISMAWGSLASTCTNALMSLRFRPTDYPWLPGTRELRRVLSFGTKLTSSTIVETAATGAPELLLGKLQSLTAVGLFSRANGLVAMFARLVTDSVNTVAVSMFAKASREGGDIARAYLTANAYVLALAWSFAAFVGCMAFPLMRVLYGDQWDGAVDLTRVLALSLAATAPAALCFQVLLAAGAAGVLLRAVLTAGAATIVGAAVGASLGLLPMGVCLAAAALVGSVTWLRLVKRVICFAWVDYLNGLCRSAGVAVSSALAPVLVLVVEGPRPVSYQLGWLALAGVGCALGFLVGVRLFGHPIGTEVDRIGAAIVVKLRHPAS